MNGLLVKLCGITTCDDARLCHREGADLLGVILTDSPRRISLAAAAEIRAAVPGAQLVGVFGGEPVSDLAAAVDAAGLDFVQLHGSSDPLRWRQVAAACNRPLLPAITADEADTAAEALRGVPDLPVAGLILDLPKLTGSLAARPHAGATLMERHGELWRAGRRLARQGVPVLLAGGLQAEALPAALRQVRPRGLDVCRGTEKRPGIKDPQLVRRFLAAARAGEREHAR
jgi:phosphoribosylanthranilate isomerase